MVRRLWDEAVAEAACADSSRCAQAHEPDHFAAPPHRGLDQRVQRCGEEPKPDFDLAEAEVAAEERFRAAHASSCVGQRSVDAAG